MYALTQLLNITNSLTSYPFGAALIIELRQDANGLYYVQIMSKNNSINQPININRVRLNQCEELCPLGNFFDITSSKLVSDFKKECSLTHENHSATTLSPGELNCTVHNNALRYEKQGLTTLELALIIVSSVFALLCLALLIVLCITYQRNRVRNTVF